MASLAGMGLHSSPAAMISPPVANSTTRVMVVGPTAVGIRGSKLLELSRGSVILNRMPAGTGLQLKKMQRKFRCFASLSPELKASLDKVVTSQKVVLFMKGTKDFPQCGFSNTVVQILSSLNVPFDTINILENEILRQGLKEYSSWPTFPQLYIDGQFFGGCDITVEAFQSGELQEVLERALCS